MRVAPDISAPLRAVCPPVPDDDLALLLSASFASMEQSIDLEKAPVQNKEAMVKDKEASMQDKEALIDAKERELFASKNELSRYRSILDPRTLMERGLEALYPQARSPTWRTAAARYVQFLEDYVITFDGEVTRLAADLKCEDEHATILGDCNSLYDRLASRVYGSLADSRLSGWLCGGSTAGCANTIVSCMLQEHAPKGTLPSEITVVDADYEPRWIMSRQGDRLRPCPGLGPGLGEVLSALSALGQWASVRTAGWRTAGPTRILGAEATPTISPTQTLTFLVGVGRTNNVGLNLILDY
jgi:hypothetical protein